jgi:hypothetical protein
MDAGIPSQASGVFDHLIGVIEGYCDLYVPPATFIIGKLYDLQPSARTARFTCKDRSEATAIRIGESYRYFDGYWGERARLSLHPALT